jgi:TonB family protein
MPLLFAFAPFATMLPGPVPRHRGRESPASQQTNPYAGRPDRWGVYTAGGEVRAPVLRYSETAIYSEEMIQANAQGTVLVTAVLGIDGVPSGTAVLVPFLRPFDAAALKATNRMRFEPATVRGLPVPIRIFVEFSFQGSSASVHPVILDSTNPVEAPAVLNSVWAAYPKRARKKRIRGTVAISFVVTKTGHPVNLRLVRSVARVLDESAIRAVRRLRFKPALRDGVPVPVQVTVDITFLLYF